MLVKLKNLAEFPESSISSMLMGMVTNPEEDYLVMEVPIFDCCTEETKKSYGRFLCGMRAILETSYYDTKEELVKQGIYRNAKLESIEDLLGIFTEIITLL